MSPAGRQQRAGGRVPKARRPVFAARDEPRAVRAEGVGPDTVAVAVADRHLLSGRRVEHQQPNPFAVRPDARQTRTIRAHGNGPRPLCPRHRYATKDLTGLAQQVKGRVPDPHRDSQPAAGLRDGYIPLVLDADRQTPVLASLQVRDAQAGARYGPGPKPVRGTGQETSTLRGQRDH